MGRPNDGLSRRLHLGRIRPWLPLGVLLVGLLAMGGCSSSESTQLPPDQRYGHRYDGRRAPDGRLNVTMTSPEPGTEYFYYPAIYDSIDVRPDAFTKREGQPPYTRVELLIKGSFPDDCTELHDVEQVRAGHVIDVSVTMRRPQGAVCNRVKRRYRFYVPLEGTFRPGDYTLTVNAFNYTFSLRVPEQD